MPTPESKTVVPHCSWRDILEGPISDEAGTILDEYFNQFAAWQKKEKDLLCVGCGSKIRVDLVGFLMAGADGYASMEWGLAHGEARCTKCGWPGRGIHYDIGPKDDPLIKSLRFMLQYHPDVVEREVHRDA